RGRLLAPRGRVRRLRVRELPREGHAALLDLQGAPAAARDLVRPRGLGRARRARRESRRRTKREGPRVKRFVAILGVLLLALFLRARGYERELWIDEAASVWCAGGDSLGETAHRASTMQGQSPLYYLALHATMKALGESRLTVRLPAILAGTLAPLIA